MGQRFPFFATALGVSSVADVVSTSLATSIAAWTAALAADSTAPQPTYSLDGKSVSQAEWRTALIANIKEAQDAINQRSPTIVWSNPFGWGNYGGW